MKLHELKIKTTYYSEVAKGNKTFELRKNDRDYQVGDLIHFVNTKGEEIKWTYQDGNLVSGQYNLYQITYVLKDVPEYGLDKDYCILGIKKMKFEED